VIQTTKKLIVIGGATATGKTTLAIQLAKHYNTEILSADSRQFYKDMSIGTAKPNPLELSEAKHHFIDNLNVVDHYSVGDYERDATALLNNLFKNHDILIMVGGTGLNIKAVCEGLDSYPNTPIELRTQVELSYSEHGIQYLQNELKRIDPLYYQEVDINNPHRLIRAITVFRASGRTFSEFRGQAKPLRPFTPIYFNLEMERQLLYDRINTRVDKMIASGLLEEVTNLIPFRNCNALQTVGYKELFDYLDGKCEWAKAIDLIKQHTRNYAKRQVTWFKKDKHWKSISAGNLEEIVEMVS
jgi:tRNA dimethylallyltransferase